MPRLPIHGLLLSAVCLASLSLLPPLGAEARDRPLELFFGNMSPAGSPPACIRDVVRELRRREHGGVNLTRMGERSIRRLAGHEDDSAFLTWTAEDLRPMLERRRETPLDAVALVDCRATEQEASMLIFSPAAGLVRVNLRGTPIDEERAFWLGRTLLLHAFIGFAP